MELKLTNISNLKVSTNVKFTIVYKCDLFVTNVCVINCHFFVILKYNNRL